MNEYRIFISGGAGVIGLELVPLLETNGAKVFVGDLKPKPKSFSNSIQYRQGDLNSITQSELEDFSPNCFVHLAATFERTSESEGFYEENFHHNLRLSHHLMNLMKQTHTVEKVLYASSYLIYDDAQYLSDHYPATPVKLSETSAIRPRNLIGISKLVHEMEIKFLSQYRQEQFAFVCLRIFRGYGKNSRDVISRWIRSAINGEVLEVYGEQSMFDYIHARDTAEGISRMLNSNLTNSIVNLGSGNSRRVSDVLRILSQHFPELRTREKTFSGQYEASESDNRKLIEILGWSPTTSLENGIADIIEHEKKRRISNPLEDKSCSILITSSSKKIPLLKSVQEAAKRASPHLRVICGDSDPNCLTRYIAEEFWEMPKLEESNLEQILTSCHDKGISIILPTRDGELQFWSKHKLFFANNNINVIISSSKSIEICRDKLLFSKFGKENKLPFIESSESPDQNIPTNWVVKERFGAGSRLIGLNLGNYAALEFSKKLISPIYQPHINGTEISIDAYLDKSSHPKGIVLRRRDVVVNGESQISSTFTDLKIEAVVCDLLKKLKLIGPVTIQAIIDENGGINIIECNARVGGASTTSIAVGLDFCYWGILEALGCSINEYPFLRHKKNVKQIRIPSDIHIYDSNF